MKKFLFMLLISTFLSNSAKADILYDGENLNDYLVYDLKDECSVHYLSQTPLDSDFFMYSETCPIKGRHSVFFHKKDGQPLDKMDGFFLDGYFIGNMPLNSTVIKRIGHNDGRQDLIYLIEKKEDITFMGKMTTTPFDGNYSKFDACPDFHIIAFVPNDANDALSQDILDMIFLSSTKYAGVLCSKTNQITIDITHTENLSDFTQSYLLVKKDGNWTKKETSQNADSHNTNQVIGYVKKNNSIWIESDILLKSDKKLTKGWHLIDGKTKPLSSFEKKKSGIPVSQEAGHISVKKDTLCQQENCLDILK